MTLDFVQPTRDPNLNIFIYGPPGSGKTVGASSAPGPILYLNADRPNATRFAHRLHGERIRETRMEGLHTLTDVTLELEDPSSDYATVVVDTLGDTYRMVLEELSDRRMRPHLNEYGDAGTYVERFVRHLCELPVNVVLVAHEMALEESDGGAERVPFCTTQSGSPVFGNKIMAAVDVVGYCGIVREEEGDPRYVAQLVDARGRRGKDSTGVLGTTHRLDLSEWVELTREADDNSDATAEAAEKEEAAA